MQKIHVSTHLVLDSISEQIIKCFKHGGKVLICGNGGSAAMSQHFAAELMVKFERERSPLPVLALTTDTSFLTACSNDYGYTEVFARQISALGQAKDVLITLSTSGKSKNILEAIKVARQIGITVIDFPRHGESTARIQENQLRLLHEVAGRVESALF